MQHLPCNDDATCCCIVSEKSFVSQSTLQYLTVTSGGSVRSSRNSLTVSEEGSYGVGFLRRRMADRECHAASKTTKASDELRLTAVCRVAFVDTAAAEENISLLSACLVYSHCTVQMFHDFFFSKGLCLWIDWNKMIVRA